MFAYGCIYGLLGLSIFHFFVAFMPPKIRNNILKTQWNDSNKLLNVQKERHGFLTFCIILELIVSIICTISSVFFALDDNILREMKMSGKDANIGIAIFSIYFLSCILLLNWKLEGFSLCCYASVILIILFATISAVVVGLVIILLNFALLQLKKNDISAWTHLYTKPNLDNVVNTASANESKNQDEYKECPFCAERIKKAATVCRFCQRTVE